MAGLTKSLVLPLHWAILHRRWGTQAVDRFIWGCIQKFPDWQPGARTVNCTPLCH